MNEKKEKIDYFQILIFILSIFSILIVFADSVIPKNHEVSTILHFADFVVCGIFLFDFFYRLKKSKNKIGFLKWGWIDFVSSLPLFGFLRYGRIIRVVRIIRAIKSAKYLYTYLTKRKLETTYLSAIFITIIMLITSSILILNVEIGSASNIKTAEDALWWSFVTMTTVGYGDYYPVTALGRLIAIILMILGISVFGIFTGIVSSWFVKESNNPEQNSELKKLENKVDELNQKIDFLINQKSD